MTRSRLSPWRRLVGLALLACLGLSSVEVVWADEPGENAAPATLAADAGEDPGADSDCACLCACACANAQQVTPAPPPLSLAPGPPPRVESRVLRERIPRAAPPEPHLRPPIA